MDVLVFKIYSFLKNDAGAYLWDKSAQKELRMFSSYFESSFSFLNFDWSAIVLKESAKETH